MIVNAQGKPYSKRDGAAYVGDFRDKGYQAGALFNYLALLGWSPGGDREIMTRDEMVRLFTLERVQPSPAQMDLQKLEWMNGEYMRALPPEAFAEGCRRELMAHQLWKDEYAADYFPRVVQLLRERLKLFSQFGEQAAYFFTDAHPVDDKAVRKRLQKPGVREPLQDLAARFARVDPFTAAGLEEVLRGCATDRGLPAADLIHPVRVAVSGQAGGPGLFELLEVLGRERVLRRLERALASCP
jgi:glutamyl-tRNA synthetase